ncbi:MAG: hypothetical protein Q9160_004869 [Pyrenula sp. 1 TL-2023]
MVSSKTPPSPSTLTIHTTTLFSPTHKTFLPNISLTISPQTGLITSIYTRTTPLPATIPPPDIDLRNLYILPGLTDAHTHILLHEYRSVSALNQTRDESAPSRTIRAVHHLRRALMAGYTTYRDLGTESLGDTDVHIRNAVNRGLTPGPRLYVATEPLASSGGYEIRVENTSLTQVPRLADPCDGVEGVRAGVRRRLGAGADVIKFYADYRKRRLRFPAPEWEGALPVQFPPEGKGGENPNLVLFTEEEIRVGVEEARRARCPVAAHAVSREAVRGAARAGVTTVEHGFNPDEEEGEEGGEEEEEKERWGIFREKGTIWVPTLSIFEALGQSTERMQAAVLRAWKAGVKLATGCDTGPWPHGRNVREIELMYEGGVPLEEVLVAATIHGWEACGGDWCGRRFGWFEAGCAADLIALKGDVREDIYALRDVDFVMKDGRVWKRDGAFVGFE